MPCALVVAVQVPGLLPLVVSVPIVRMQFDACDRKNNSIRVSGDVRYFVLPLTLF